MNKPITNQTRGKVYMLWAVGTHRIKIGFTTTTVSKRALKIAEGSPFPFRVLGHFYGKMEHEKQLHERLADFRVHGEWFEVPEKVAWRLLKLFGNKIPDDIDLK